MNQAVMKSVKVDRKGNYFIIYDCPECNSELISPESELFMEDVCPKCQSAFITPTKESFQNKLNLIEEKKRRAEEEKEYLNRMRRDSENKRKEEEYKKKLEEKNRIAAEESARREKDLNSQGSNSNVPIPNIEQPAHEPFKVKSSVVGNGTIVELLEFKRLNGTSITPKNLEFLFLSERLGINLNQVRIRLEGSACQLQAGALQYLRGQIQIENDVKGLGSFLKNTFKASVTGETVMKPVYHGTGEIYCEPSFGYFLIEKLENQEVVINDGIFYAVESSISIETISLGFKAGALGGQGFFQSKLKGTGWVVLELPVPESEIIKYKLNGPNDVLKVDGTFGILRKGNIKFQVEKSTKSLIGSSLSGEGVLQTYSGFGEVWVAPTMDTYKAIELASELKNSKVSDVVSRRTENALTSVINAIGS